MRVQEQSPPLSGITQQTVYQHESHITVWLRTSEDSFILTNTKKAVWSCCLGRVFQHKVILSAPARGAPLTCVAVRSGPAFQTRLVSVVVAGVMAEELVPGPAKLVATKAVVVLVADDPDLVLKLRHRSVMRQLLPLWAGVDHSRMGGFLY